MTGARRGRTTPPADAPGNQALDTDVQDAQAGDERAFATLYRAVHPGLIRYLRVLVGQDADDVASEAWSQVCRDLARFNGDGDGFRGWVTTIARNRAIDHLRARGRRPMEFVEPETLREIAGDNDTAADAVDALGTAEALGLIAGLPPDQAEAVLLRVVMGLDAKAAAAVLGKRPGAVRTSAYRGLKTLALRVEGDRQ